MTLQLKGVSHGELVQITAAFAPGAHTVLGTERDGTGTLIALCAGLVPPGAGSVLVDGVAPFRHAAARRTIASLAAEEALPPSHTVQRALDLALRARGSAVAASALLEAAGLGRFAKHAPDTLSARERRALALVLALAHPKPRLLALHEPLALVGLVTESFVLEALTRHASTGSIIVCTASRVEDATRLGGATSALDRGIWLDSARARLPLSEVTLRVRTPEPRRLAARLSEAPDITAVEWAGGPELLIRGRELLSVASSVVSNARAEAIRIEALRYDPPGLEALAAARAGLAQAWYERARAEGAPPFAATGARS